MTNSTNQNTETVPNVPAIEPKPVARRELHTTQTGSVTLSSIGDQLAFAKTLIDNGMVSETFKTPAQVVIGFQYAKALRLNEIVALKMMYVVGGKPSLYGEGPLSLCQREGLVEKIEEFYVDGEGERICVANKNLKATVYASVTRVWRKGDDIPQEDFFTLDDLARAKLDVSKYGKKEIWSKWERIMMRYKARSMALRSKFADLIAGIPIAEYDSDFTPELPEIKDVDNTSSTAKEINALYLGEEKKDQGSSGTEHI